MSDGNQAEPRIHPLAAEELGESGLALAAKLRSIFGLKTAELPETVATMLRHPDLYGAFIDYVGLRAKASVLAPRDLEIVTLRTAMVCGSGYVWAEHVNFGRKAGLTDEEIAWLAEGSAALGWNERDRALNRMAEELHEVANVTDATWATIADYFTEQQIIELLMMAGAYHEVAFLYSAMRVRLMPGSLGLAAR